MFSNNQESIVSTIAAMCEQEERGYKTSSYLYQSQPQQASFHGPLNAAEEPVDIDCRDKMVAWCFQVVDFCKFSRETVSIAINYLDRFLASPAGGVARTNRKVFQLAAMTSLYTAVKIHEPEAMDPQLVSTLSRGTYTPQEVEAMEACLLSGLQWRLNPPTALAFVRHFMELLPEGLLDDVQRNAVYDVAKFQTELAVSEYDFLTVKASVVGYASLVNALESVGVDLKALSYLADLLLQTMPTNSNNTDSVYEVQNWLYRAILEQPALQSVTTQQQQHRSSSQKVAQPTSPEVSPRSISATR